MTALTRGDERAVITFLESSPLLRERPEFIHHGPDGTTLLHLAAARLMPEVAFWALSHGADVNRPSGNGFMPIDMLGRWPTGHPHDRLEELSDLLLRHGAGLLTAAVEHGRLDMLQLLLDLGFDADERRRLVGGDGV